MNTPAPAGGMARQLASQTPLAGATGKLRMICPMCGTDFLRFASRAKRANVSYCGNACAWASKVTRYEHHCVVCDASMLLQPSEGKRKLTCSPACSSARKRSRGMNSKPSSWRAYQDAASVIRAAGVCCRCGAQHGPWIVRGLRVYVEDGKTPAADTSAAFLVCNRCHFEEIGAVGAKVVHEKLKQPNARVQPLP